MRKIVFYKNYFYDFYNGLEEKVQKKIEWTLGLLRDLDKVPDKYFRYIVGTKGIFEIRIQVETNIFRIFAFFDKGDLVILINGFIKKTNKTPNREIKLAEKLMKEYYEEKKSNN